MDVINDDENREKSDVTLVPEDQDDSSSEAECTSFVHVYGDAHDPTPDASQSKVEENIIPTR